jgi:hypothetical protein
MFLMIQNLGVAPVESFTLLGASGNRDNPETLGEYGSGNKLAVTALLRLGVDVTVYCGTTRLVFGTRDDEFNGNVISRVTVTENNRATRDLGWTLDWGAKDWTTASMALREFVSNALDAHAPHTECVDPTEGDLQVTAKSIMRAKDGYTRVFISSCVETDTYLWQLSSHFLHFSDVPITKTILDKTQASDRLGGDGAMIYRKGAYLCTLPGESVYDYNFTANEIEIDECRNSNEYSVRAAIARRLRQASAEELAPIFKAIGARREVMEAKLDAYYLLPSWQTPTDGEKTNWQNAWKIAHNDAVLTDPQSRALEFVQKKGLRTQEVDSATWREAMGRFGIKGEKEVLTVAERAGRKVTGVGVDEYKNLACLWSLLDNSSGTREKKMPSVGGFDNEGGNVDHYFVEEDTVYIDNTLEGVERDMAHLHALAQYITGCSSCELGFRDFAYNLLLMTLFTARKFD